MHILSTPTILILECVVVVVVVVMVVGWGGVVCAPSKSTGEHKGQWRGAFMFSLICVWHYDVIVRIEYWICFLIVFTRTREFQSDCTRTCTRTHGQVLVLARLLVLLGTQTICKSEAHHIRVSWSVEFQRKSFKLLILDFLPFQYLIYIYNMIALFRKFFNIYFKFFNKKLIVKLIKWSLC